MNTKENWIDETINALDTIQRVEVPLSLSYSLVNNLKPKEIRLSSVQKWTIAASILVLLGINLISISHYSKKLKTSSLQSSETNIVYKEYFSIDFN
jgi:S-methylmethionine-dependent homocysteine/selenocysteine methylase